MKCLLMLLQYYGINGIICILCLPEVTAMLQLKSLEVQGFKSFPDKTKIDFSRGITAIVGPNGSGKSNIADAIRWVMGETSTKNLRGAKMEDVIFDGTKTRKQVGFAQVSLYLDNSDGELPVGFSEVCLTRRYYRSGESEYAINSKPARLRDIQELLRDTGLGKDGYSIIGQGAITEIINAKSTDRRYLFEEAAGIAKYKAKKEESKKKLALTQENILRLGDILAELRERLPVLESQAEKAKQYLALREEKKVLDVGLWLHAAKTWQETLEKARQTAETLETDRQKAEQELAGIQDEAERNEALRRELTVSIEETRGDIKQIELSIQEKKAQILLLKNDAEHTAAEIQRLEEENRAEEQEQQLSLQEKGHIAEEIRKAEEEAGRLESEKHEIERQKAEKAEKALSFYRKAEEIRSRLAEKEKELAQKITEKAVAEEAAAQTEQRIKTLVEETLSAADRKKSLQKACEEAEQAVREQEEKREENKNILKGHELKYANQAEKCKTLAEEERKLTAQLAEKENRKKLLEDMEKSHEGFSGSVHRVINDAKRGVLQGIHGTVASLIAVQKEYAVAVETALGAGIQNIITETEADAKNAIFHLKNQRAGRATFLPVQTIRGRKLEESNIKKGDGYLGIASELIGYEPKYKDVITFLLGKTVIADSLDNGSAIAKKNGYAFRVVTTDGQVINAGGSLTGGSAAKNVGILSRKNEIATLGEQAADLRNRLEKTLSARKEAEGEENRLAILANSVRDEITRLEKQLIAARAESDHTRTFLQNLQEQENSFRTEEESLKKEAARQKETIRTAEKETADLTEQITAVNSELETLGKENTALQQEENALSAAIQEKELNLLSIKSKTENLRFTILRSEESLQKSKEKINRNRALQQECEKTIVQFEEKQAEAEKEIAEAEVRLGETGAQITEKRARRDMLEKENAALYEKEKQLYALKEKLARETEKTHSGIENAKNSLQTMESRLWDEYEITVSEAKNDFAVPENIPAAKNRAEALKTKIRTLGTVNLEAIDEFVAVKERFEELDRQTADLIRSKEELEKIIESLEMEMTKVFREKFGEISREFERVFKKLFDGGEAKLSLTDSENVLESGIDIFVAPPGKVIKSMSLLSGGEQALTSIALYFAILNIHPAPFCLLDEIEAALDDVNVSRYAEYLHRLTANTQLITITHRRGTMEIADRLYGVTMREKGISKILMINVDEIERNLQPT